MKVDFAQTQSERMAAGDPRPSIEERHETHVSYVNKVTAAALKLRARSLLPDEDVALYIAAAEASEVGVAGSIPSAVCRDTHITPVLCRHVHTTLRPSADLTVKQTNVHYSQYMHCAGEPPDAAQEEES